MFLWHRGVGPFGNSMRLRPPRPDDDGARAALSDTVIRSQQHVVRQFVIADHPALCFIEQQLELGAAFEAVDVLDYEDLRTPTRSTTCR